METLALFENGPARRIILGFLDPEDDPVKPLAINIDNLQMIHAANNGFYAAYQVLRHLGYITGTKYCFSYQLEAGAYAIGASAGLAFSLKFAQAVYPGRALFPYNLAATGVISDGTKDAQVKRVKGLQPKLRAALRRLHRGDRLYYPAANEADVDDALRMAATDKGIELMPVATLMDAIATLLSPPPPPEPTRAPQISRCATPRSDAVHGSEAELPRPPAQLYQPWLDRDGLAVGEAALSQEPYTSEQSGPRQPGVALSLYTPSLMEGMATGGAALDDEEVVSVDARHEPVLELRADDVAHLETPVVRQRSASAAQSPSIIPRPSSNTLRLLVRGGLAAAMVGGLLFVGSLWLSPPRPPLSTPSASDERSAAPTSPSVPPAPSPVTEPAFNSQGEAQDEQQGDRGTIEDYMQASQRPPEEAKAYDEPSLARRAQDKQMDTMDDQKTADLAQRHGKTSDVQENRNQRTEVQKPAPTVLTPHPPPTAGRKPGMPKYAKKVGWFLKFENGTALDTTTNLMWMTKDFRTIERRSPQHWNEAMAWVEQMNRRGYGGYSDWRAPTPEEYKAAHRLNETKGSSPGYPVVFEDGGGVWFWSNEEAGDGKAYGFNSRWGSTTAPRRKLEIQGDESIRLVRTGPSAIPGKPQNVVTR